MQLGQLQNINWDGFVCFHSIMSHGITFQENSATIEKVLDIQKKIIANMAYTQGKVC
jgi:hypothetical protein